MMAVCLDEVALAVKECKLRLGFWGKATCVYDDSGHKVSVVSTTYVRIDRKLFTLVTWYRRLAHSLHPIQPIASASLVLSF